LRALVAKGHKNTNAPLIFENLGYYFFWFWANYIMAHYVVCPQKKIISRIFKISGALIVIMRLGTSKLGFPPGFTLLTTRTSKVDPV
jgi:hypothetical protein